MVRGARPAVFFVTIWACVMFAVAGAPRVAATGPAEVQLSADLDGRPIKLSAVGNWYCDDFAYPKIHCYSDPRSLEQSVAPMLASTSTTYVVVYEQPTYAGSYMYISQDYTILGALGWNDRISSFSTRNGGSGHFYTDWFYGGTSWYFCCDAQEYYLGGYDNTFSSVHRG